MEKMEQQEEKKTILLGGNLLRRGREIYWTSLLKGFLSLIFGVAIILLTVNMEELRLCLEKTSAIFAAKAETEAVLDDEPLIFPCLLAEAGGTLALRLCPPLRGAGGEWRDWAADLLLLHDQGKAYEGLSQQARQHFLHKDAFNAPILTTLPNASVILRFSEWLSACAAGYAEKCGAEQYPIEEGSTGPPPDCPFFSKTVKEFSGAVMCLNGEKKSVMLHLNGAVIGGSSLRRLELLLRHYGEKVRGAGLVARRGLTAAASPKVSS